MQKESPPQFKFNSKVLAIIALTLGALFIPVATVVVAFHLYFKGPSAEEEKIAIEPLKQAFEGVAEKSLLAPSLSEGRREVRIQSADLVGESKRIHELARQAGGGALTDPGLNQQVRLLASLPADRVESFVSACADPGLKLAPSKGSSGAEVVLVEVIIDKPAQ